MTLPGHYVTNQRTSQLHNLTSLQDSNHIDECPGTLYKREQRENISENVKEKNKMKLILNVDTLRDVKKDCLELK